LSEFSACFVSHKHDDHNHSAAELEKRGIDVRYGDGLIFTAANDLVVESFEVPHTVPCFGFIIKSGVESMVFMTDLSYCPAPFFFSPTIFALECNYAADLIPEDCNREDSVYGAHMSLDTCIKTLKTNDLSKTRGIWLLHISRSHGDPERFVREVQEATGIATYAAPAYKKKGAR